MAISRGCWPFRGLFHGRPFRAPRDPRRTYRKARPASMRSSSASNSSHGPLGRLKTTLAAAALREARTVRSGGGCRRREQGYAFAPLRMGHQKPFRFKLIKRLTDGSPADAAFLGYARLADPIPAAEFSVTDALADEVDDLFAVCRFIKLLHRLTIVRWRRPIVNAVSYVSDTK